MEKIKEMFSNIKFGFVVKVMAVCLALLEILGCIVFGIILIINYYVLLGIMLIIFGAVPVLIINIILYAFGQLVDNTDKLVKGKKYVEEDSSEYEETLADVNYETYAEKFDPEEDDKLEKANFFDEPEEKIEKANFFDEPEEKPQPVKEPKVEVNRNREQDLINELKAQAKEQAKAAKQKPVKEKKVKPLIPEKKVPTNVVKQYYASEIKFYENIIMFESGNSIELDDIKNLKNKNNTITFNVNNDSYVIKYLSHDEASNSLKDYKPKNEVYIYWDDSLINNGIMYYKGKEIIVPKKKKLEFVGNTVTFLFNGVTYKIEFFNNNEIDEFKKAIGIK